MTEQSKRGPIPVKILLGYKVRADKAEARLHELELAVRLARGHLLQLSGNPRVRNDPTAMMVVEDMRRLLKDHLP